MQTTKPLSVSFVDPQSDGGDTRNTLAIRFSAGRYDRIVRFECSGAPLAASGDALLCLGLIPAMELGVDLHIEADVDEGLLANAAEIQALLCDWYPGYRQIGVKAGTTKRTYPDGRGAGLFFSGGVDSSYSLAAESDRLTGLVTLLGADVDFSDKPRVERLEAISRNAATQFGLTPIFVRTDIRKVSDRLIGWVEYHGALLAAVRHMLANEFETMLVASSADQSSWTRRWGSHPALDRLWGTGGARMEHHGLVDRLAKIERIGREPALMRQLRVCNHEFDNCGTCPKCRFMIAAFDLLDLRDKAVTFSHVEPAPPHMEVTGLGSLSDLKKMRDAALARGGHEQLVGSIEEALRRYGRTQALKRITHLDEAARRFKRFKRQRRFRQQVNRSGG